ncbi:MAG: hypothetical protein WCH34_02750 [Bacteroidota bacterium]
MKFPDILYYMFYCLTKETSNERHLRACFLIENAFSLLLSSITFIIVAILKVESRGLVLGIIFMLIYLIISLFIFHRYYISSGRFNKIIEKGDEFTLEKRKQLAKRALIIIINCFVLFVGGGAFMNY